MDWFKYVELVTWIHAELPLVTWFSKIVSVADSIFQKWFISGPHMLFQSLDVTLSSDRIYYISLETRQASVTSQQRDVPWFMTVVIKSGMMAVSFWNGAEGTSENPLFHKSSKTLGKKIVKVNFVTVWKLNKTLQQSQEHLLKKNSCILVIIVSFTAF